MFRFNICAVLLAALYLQSSEAIKCKEETLVDAPTKSDRFCVFRDVTWRSGVAEPVFEEPIGSQVAFIDSNLTSIPDSFFAKVPRLETLLANNVHLKQLKIKNGMKEVYAEGNSIGQLIVDGGRTLKELYLSKNAEFKDLSSLSALVGLEKLDLSETGFAASQASYESINFTTFANMPNLTVLRLANDQIHYIEIPQSVKLPNLKVLDLQGNPIIPANFEMSIFRSLPNLEELNMHSTWMVELSVSPNIRDDLPALKKINIGDMHLKCKFMRALLDELKDKEIEVLGTTSTPCLLGYQAMDGFCCQNDGYVPTPPPTPPPPPTTTQKSEDLPTPPPTKAPQPGPNTPKPKSDSETGDEGGSSTVVIVSVIFAIILLVGVGVFVAIYLKRRNEATHKQVPGQESNDNL